MRRLPGSDRVTRVSRSRGRTGRMDRKEESMYVGLGTVLLIVLIVILIVWLV
jgi:hypothetical protein